MSKSSKVYIVLERDYEYNDETYNARDGGNAVLAFASRDLAEREAIRRAVDQFRNGGVCVLYNNYSLWTKNDAWVGSPLHDVLKKNGLDVLDLEDYDDFDKFTDRCKTIDEMDLIVLAKHLDQPMFYVQEVELSQ